ncbi:hypothetical protein BJ875DRAFT_521129 [Amylocarpus encephaloides]|uniref:DUF6594 domain-containing protein n=1 Tax=Amylocarpus encephaloides TaxID=45428 RepID=A0A9P7YQ96_9HELO|nr:hypothetical protein BJ875DRAFT_521129 [Amylocarpus encephaloides]
MPKAYVVEIILSLIDKRAFPKYLWNMAAFGTDIDFAEKGCMNQDFPDYERGDSQLKCTRNADESSIAGTKAYPDQHIPSKIPTNISYTPREEITGSSQKIKSLMNDKVCNKAGPSRPQYPDIISRDFETYPQGFPRLAAFQNSSPDLAIFRRFGTEHCRVLMHLQCEIISISKELDILDLSDSDEKNGLLYRLRRNEWHEGWDRTQKDLLENLQKKLSIYDDILLKDRGLRASESPKSQHYQSLYNWILGTKPLDGGQYEFLFNQDDFVASKPNSQQSRFDEIIEAALNRRPKLNILQKFLGEARPIHQERKNNRVHTFSRTKTAFVAKIFALVIAYAILILPVILLYLTPMSDGARAGIVLIFVPAFGVFMSLFIKAKVEAVFVGTCTFCAVLVTFLGNVQEKERLG